MDKYSALPVLPPALMDSSPRGYPNKTSSLPRGGAPRHLCNTQLAIEALNSAITQSERIESLQLTFRTISHSDTDQHDYELQLGLDKALCLKLGYVVVASLTLSEEIRLICQCFIQLYNCSSESKKRSFRHIGATELAPLLVQVLLHSLTSAVVVDEEPHERTLVSVIQLLRIYAKLESAKPMLMRHNHGDWLGKILLHLIDMLEHNRVEYPQTATELLGLVKDLSFRSSSREKESLCSLGDGALGHLLLICCPNDTAPSPRLVEWFTAVMWNLVLDKSLCRQLMEGSSDQGISIAQALLRALDDGGNTESTTTRARIGRNATSAMGNILADTNNQRLLFQSNDSLEIIQTFMRLVQENTDSVVRRRAMRTLRCLASSKEGNTQSCVEQEHLVPFLVDTISRNVSLDDDDDRDMQIQACHTMISLVPTLQPSDWPRIETALLQRVETTTNPKLTQAACLCLVECIRGSPWKRGGSCFSEVFWMRLETAASASPDTHGSIASLLLHLAKAESNIDDGSHPRRQSTLTSLPIVNTLTTLVSQPGEQNESTRRDALAVVTLLARDESNKRPLAENEGLLSGLVELCLMQSDEVSKDSAKQAILNLVPEL